MSTEKKSSDFAFFFCISRLAPAENSFSFASWWSLREWREILRVLIKKEIYAKRDFQDFYVAHLWRSSVENSTAKICQKFSFLYLHSIQLAIPKTKIISLCFISLVALGFAVNISATGKRERDAKHHENLERCRQVQNSITVKKFNPGKSFVICITAERKKIVLKLLLNTPLDNGSKISLSCTLLEYSSSFQSSLSLMNLWIKAFQVFCFVLWINCT